MDNIWIPDSFVLRSEVATDDPLFDPESSFDSLGSVVDANVDFKKNDGDYKMSKRVEKPTFVKEQVILPPTKALPEFCQMQENLDQNGLDPVVELEQRSQDCLSTNYPEIALPVAQYINERNPEWCTEAEKYKKLMQVSKIQSSLYAEGSKPKGALISPFNSMAATTEALALQNSVIGNHDVKPVSPDVVAQVVASVQNRLQQQSSTNYASGDSKEHEQNMLQQSLSGTIFNNSESMEISSADIPIPSSRRSSISSISSLSSRKNTLKSSIPSVHSSQKLQKASDPLNSPPLGGKLVFMDRFLDSETESCFSEKLEIESNCSETFDTESNISDTSGIFGDAFLANISTNTVPRLGASCYNTGEICKSSSSIEVNGILPSAGSIQKREQCTETEYSELFDVMRAKANLEGRLESISQKEVDLSEECSSLQTLVTSLQTQVAILTKQSEQALSEKQNALKKVELLNIQQEKWNIVFKEYQNMIESKNAEIDSLKENISEVEQANIQAKINYEELKVDLDSKEGACSGLKKKIAELHVEVQVLLQSKVQLQNEVKNGQHDVDMLQKSKQWYQDQLHATQESRDKLHKDFISLQAENITLNNNMEKSKTEIKHLKQQLTENHQRAMTEKEGLLKHLETIEADMLERESLFDEMQKDKGSVEDALHERAKRMAEERSKLSHLMLTISDLQGELNIIKSDVCDKSKSILALEKQKAELYRQVALLQKTVSDKDLTGQHLLENLKDANAKIAHNEMSLKSFEALVEQLKEEKNKTDMALAASDEERRTVNESLKALKSNLSKIENNFKQMKTELVMKTAKVEQLMKEKSILQESQKRLEESVLSQQRNFEQQIGFDSQNNSVIIDDLRKQKIDIENILQVYSKDLLFCQQQIQALELKNKNLNNELFRVKNKAVQSQDPGDLNFKSNMDMLKSNEEVVPHKNAGDSKDFCKLKVEYQSKLKVYCSNIKVLTRKLKEKLKECEQLKNDVQELKNSDDPSKDSLFASDPLLFEKNKALEEELSVLRGTLNEEQNNVLQSQKIIIELEKERGKMSGAQENSNSLKLRVNQLESKLSEKEAAIVQLTSQIKEIESSLKDQSSSNQSKMLFLEGEVAKNNVVIKGLRQQVFQEKRISSHNQRQLTSLKSALEEVNQTADARKQEIKALQFELDSKMQTELKHRAEKEKLQTQILSLQADVQKLKNKLDEMNAKDPELAQQIISLTWHLKEKKNEVAALNEKIAFLKEGHTLEAESFEKILKSFQSEMEKTKSELDIVRKQKFHYQSQLTQLRKAFKTNFGKDAINSDDSADDETKYNHSDDFQPPFDESYVNSLLEKSLQISESRPLNHLQSCLNSLKQEMADLQKQLHSNDPPVS